MALHPRAKAARERRQARKNKKLRDGLHRLMKEWGTEALDEDDILHACVADVEFLLLETS